MATTYRLIGKGTTSNGVAHMTKKTTNNGSSWTDCNGYTGTGKGRLNLIASTDSTIGSGSLQSAPYQVLDTIWNSNGLTPSNVSSYFAYWNSTANTVSNDGDWITISTDSSQYSGTYMQISPYGFEEYTYSLPLKCEIEVDSVSNYIICCHVKKSDGTNDWNSVNLSQGRWRVETTSTSMKIFKNDVQQWSKSLENGSTQRIYLQSTRASGNGNIKFKNFLIYPF